MSSSTTTIEGGDDGKDDDDDDDENDSSSIPVDYDSGVSSQNKKKKKWDRDWLIKLVRTSSSAQQTQKEKFNNTNSNNDDNDDTTAEDEDQLLLLQDKIFATAPMIEQSDTAFRILTRRYGSNLCFTPMIHAHTFLTKKSYRDKMFRPLTTVENEEEVEIVDRPLIAQIAGSHKDLLLQVAKLLEPYVDAIDLNCGCPTQKAKRGRYGAFLLSSSGNYVIDIVQHLTTHLSCPITMKVRLLLPNDDDDEGNLESNSLDLYERLVTAGVSMLTIHGRTRNQIGTNIGSANWEAIRNVVQRLGHRIPIIANGNLSNYNDVIQCLKVTGADGVMSSEAILEYPPNLFFGNNQPSPSPPTSIALLDGGDDDEEKEASRSSVISIRQRRRRRPGPGRLQIAYEYLELCQKYPPEYGNGGTGIQCMCMHIDTFLYGDWIDKEDKLRLLMLRAERIEDLYTILQQIQQRQQKKNHNYEEEQLCWYYRHRK